MDAPNLLLNCPLASWFLVSSSVGEITQNIINVGPHVSDHGNLQRWWFVIIEA